MENIILDVSQFQPPEQINYKELAKQISGVFIRIGYTGYITGKTAKDAAFEKHYAEFKKQKIPIGVYYVSVGNSAEMGMAEARACLKLLDNKEIELGIFCDTEWIEDNPKANFIPQSYPKRKLTACVLSFCQTIQNARCPVGIYASENWFTDYLDSKYLEPYDWWVANYKEEPKIKYKYWQYTSRGKLEGYSSDVDLSRLGKGERMRKPEKYCVWLKKEAEISVLQDQSTITHWQKYNNPFRDLPLVKLGGLRINGEPYPEHKGIDWAVPEGTPIYAPYDGKIWTTSDMKTTGNRIVLTAAGKKFGANHLSNFVVTGGYVSAGQLIAYSGNTGKSTGAHLHVDVFDSKYCYDVYPYALGLWDEYGNEIKTEEADEQIYPYDPDEYEYELNEPINYIVDTTGKNLNIRARPGTTFNIVGQLKNGESVRIDKRCDYPDGTLWGRKEKQPWNWICLRNEKEWLVKEPRPKLYRVRKTKDDAKSQIGAFRNLDNAKRAAIEGYFIFDEEGEMMR